MLDNTLGSILWINALQEPQLGRLLGFETGINS